MTRQDRLLKRAGELSAQRDRLEVRLRRVERAMFHVSSAYCALHREAELAWSAKLIKSKDPIIRMIAEQLVEFAGDE